MINDNISPAAFETSHDALNAEVVASAPRATNGQDTDKEREEQITIKNQFPKIAAPKRKRRGWTEEEEKRLREGISQYGPGQWAKIRDNYGFKSQNQDEGRSCVNLKDKWRNMNRENIKKADQEKKKLSKTLEQSNEEEKTSSLQKKSRSNSEVSALNKKKSDEHSENDLGLDNTDALQIREEEEGIDGDIEMIHDTIPPITTGIESNATSSINNPGLNQSSSSVPPQSEPTTKGQIVKKAKISEWVPAAIQWITENLVRHDSGKVHVATIRKMFTESNFFPDSELVNHDQVEMANLKYDLQNPKTASSKKFKALALESVVGTDCIRQNCFMNGSNELGLFGWIIKPQNSANNEQGAQKKSKAISSGQSEETILLSTTPHEPKGQNSVHTNTDGNDILPSPPTKNSENTTTPHHQHREQLQSPKQQQPKRHPHHHMSKYSSLPRPSPSININTVPSHQNHRTSFTFQSMPMDSHVHTSVQGPQGTTHIPPTFDDTSQSTEHNQQHQDKRARIAKSDFNDFATIHHSNQPDHIDNRQAMDSEYYHNQPQSVTLVSHVLDAVAPAPVSSEQDTDNADAK